MRIRKYRFGRVLLILPIVILISCKEPIDLKLAATDPKIVIDGFITDSFRPQSIRLSYSSGFTDRGLFEPNRIENATVIVEDDQGDDEFAFVHIGNGEYESTSFFAEEDKSYRVVIDLEGEQYVSSFESLPENDAPNPASVSYAPELNEQLSTQGQIVTSEGVGVYVDITKSDETVYYQWLIEHWFIAEAFFAPGRFCYARDFEIPRVVVLEDNPRQMGEGEDYDHRVEFVPVSIKTKRDFVVVATQLILTQDAFEYWNSIHEQSENTGSLFDPAPFSVTGNAKNIRTDEPVLGYFGVYRESVARTFFSEGELPYEEREYPCNPPPVTPNHCTDCTLWSAVSIETLKPQWWR